MDWAIPEFERQVATLLALGYPGAAGVGEGEFVTKLESLKVRLPDRPRPPDDPGPAPFVIVLQSTIIPVAFAMERTAINGKAGVSDLTPRQHEDFAAIPLVHLPDAAAYLVIDIDSGTEYLNLPPEGALNAIVHAGRSPLTMEEGIALITHFPALLRKNGCFSLSGSRCGDQRVPAIWISGGRPRLGWCWDRNPHTWLGSASCLERTGAD